MARERPGIGIAPLFFAPLTLDRWADLVRLFGPRGACGGCWCMNWRLPKQAFEQGKGAGNRRAFRAVIRAGARAEGHPPGVLAYDSTAAADQPIGWCAIAPRRDYTRLALSRVLKPIDAEPVWSIACLFVARSQRRSGVSVALLDAAAKFAAARGARMVEGYPVAPRTPAMPDAFAWTGTVSAFLEAGFHEAARGSPVRPIMRRAVR